MYDNNFTIVLSNYRNIIINPCIVLSFLPTPLIRNFSFFPCLQRDFVYKHSCYTMPKSHLMRDMKIRGDKNEIKDYDS